MDLFKINDSVVCIDASNTTSYFYNGESYYVHLNEVENYGPNQLRENCIYTIKDVKSSSPGFYSTRFRLATPAEVRKAEGFHKELEELINET